MDHQSKQRLGAPAVYNPFARTAQRNLSPGMGKAPPVYRPALAQPKHVPATSRGPAGTAPPVYRPQANLQRQTASAGLLRSGSGAPPVYRPQKMAATAAPPVYRPGVVQPSRMPLGSRGPTVAPPVYRPGKMMNAAPPARFAPQTRALQRKIRIGTPQDFEEFDPEVDFVQEKWGFSSEHKQTYLTLLRDNSHHYFTNVAAMITAVKAAPVSRSFAKHFNSQTGSFGGSHWLEQYLTDPDAASSSFSQTTATELVDMLGLRGSGVTGQQLGQMNYRQLLDEMLQRGNITQSCGQTAGLVHEILNSANQAPSSTPKAGVRNKIEEANVLSVAERDYVYVRIEGGGHAFIVEVFKNTCRIYQSFFNVSTLARELEANRTFPISEFLAKLDTALDDDDDASDKVMTTRRALFGGSAFHPEANFRVTIFRQEAGATDRLRARAIAGRTAWTTYLNRPATEFLAQNAQQAPALAQGRHTFNSTDGYLYYDEDYSPVAFGALLADGKTTYVLRDSDNTYSIKISARTPLTITADLT